MKKHIIVLAALTAAVLAPPAIAQRLKDLASVSGVRANQLVGYGLVVGLDGTGDQTTQTPFTVQAFNNMLRQFGIQLPPGQNIQLKNVAAVSVHAELAAFAKPGQATDVTVSSIGNAKSLRGGTLLVTPLKGLDGQVYAVAQGNLVVGGFGVEGADGSSVTVNVPSVGRIPGGALIERPSPNAFDQGNQLVFNLHRSDFTTARRVTEQINETFGPEVARALDGGSIAVRAPTEPDQKVSFLAVLENLEVDASAAPARVIINSRTGTIVIGERVEVAPASLLHRSLGLSEARGRSLQLGGDAPLDRGAGRALLRRGGRRDATLAVEARALGFARRARRAGGRGGDGDLLVVEGDRLIDLSALGGALSPLGDADIGQGDLHDLARRAAPIRSQDEELHSRHHLARHAILEQIDRGRVQAFFHVEHGEVRFRPRAAGSGGCSGLRRMRTDTSAPRASSADSKFSSSSIRSLVNQPRRVSRRTPQASLKASRVPPASSHRSR